ncbi:hypothetical protein BCR37DRAFT_389377 [Protomyces lactucae-debilis]|uniref:mRNA 3'-end-processing protein n=1 Tax=Protomyces lactucae-debilis TaxID=2754530 RepID=A0A1Y2EZH8_PROLT|nr:uncharacterized protein BCR37DRAFT_389374 [Protomyces lactucae-debilis]XP_040722754.1 uncharacterized protein BCR37DRAFT_389377 [Protomyces lactucae-debilis]ORY76670.1 hypothetical protein BCR37DRAFT_389374 [Protomyces lactucae-debilis]ORY76674.1 hypothetical protein BCR37DRAFT_389377 [Protomyces lactucae-debilis]
MAQRVQTSTSMPLRTIDKGDSSLLSASTGCVVYMRHVQECKQWKVQGTCGNAEDCLYAHPALGSRNGVCDWYKLGYCPLGPDCKRKHIRRKPCMCYLTGFCPYGLDCKDAHLQFLVPPKAPPVIPMTAA